MCKTNFQILSQAEMIEIKHIFKSEPTEEKENWKSLCY